MPNKMKGAERSMAALITGMWHSMKMSAAMARNTQPKGPQPEFDKSAFDRKTRREMARAAKKAERRAKIYE